MAAFGDLSISLSKRARDTVSAFATDGSTFTSAARTDYLNKAMNALQQFVFVIHKERAREILQSQIGTGSLAVTSSGIAVPSTYNQIPLSFVSSSIFYTYHPRREELSSGVAFTVPYGYTIEAGLLFAYTSGTSLNTTGTLTFVKSDTHTTDEAVLLSTNLHDTLVDLAAAFALADIGEIEESAKFYQRAASILKGM
jgi:hypothetical protein